MAYVTTGEVIKALQSMTSKGSNLSMSKKRGIKYAIRHISKHFSKEPLKIYKVKVCEGIEKVFNDNGTIINALPFGRKETKGYYVNPSKCIKDCLSDKKLFASNNPDVHYKYAYITCAEEGIETSEQINKWLSLSEDGITIMPNRIKDI